MKKFIAMLLLAAMLVSLFAGCKNDSDTPTTQTPTTGTTVPPTTVPTEPADPWAEYECITVAEALSLSESHVDAPSAEWYYIKATVDSVDNDKYGQLTISDGTGSIMVYGSYNADGSVRYDAMTEKPKAGDQILIYGCLQNYKGNTKEVQKGYIIDFISNDAPPAPPAELPADGSQLTVGELLALPVAEGDTTTQHYIVQATVESVSNPTYGAMYITDETGTISVYNSKNADGSLGYADMEDRPFKGDTVTLKCTVQNFQGQMEIKQAYILEFTHAVVDIDPSEYPETAISAIRDAAVGTKATVSGVIAQMIFDGNNNPCGFILVDRTSSIYVYDSDLAARVAKGNTVTLAGSKTYWINSKEQSAADKYGYRGSCQLENVTLLNLDASVKEFDTSWIQETTVKEIMDTPVDQDITNKIFKVTALIKRDSSFGNWVNYYIDDLDGITGSYCYSQCDGADYAWLDAYDGKICTLYLVALNAKCASDGCVWRFLPVAVIDDTFDPTLVNVPEFIVKYHGLPQFSTSYSGDPALKLLTNLDSDVLGFQGAALSYTSSDPSVISVDSGVMHCLKTGEATVTVTGSYGGKTYREKVTIQVTISDGNATYPTVSDAISATLNDTVTVSGIVGPSLVNKTGFYLIDDTGVIAVLTDKATMETIEMGQQVVLEGLRDRFHNNEGDHAGQTCITNAVVVQNMYGNHNYSTKTFVTGKTVTELYNLDAAVDYSTTVFVVTATVGKGNGQWATFHLTDGTTQFTLYSSSTAQYGWLEQFLGQEVTIEVATCNWNNKKYWRGCVLSVTDASGNTVYNTLNFE